MKIIKTQITLILSLIIYSQTLYSLELNKEWIDTNSLGSVISGTVGLANTRNYHAHYVVINPYGERITLVNNIEAKIETNEGIQHFLSSNYYKDNVIYPNGQDFLESFVNFPFPTWNFAFENNLRISKEVVYLNKSETVVIRYKTNSQKPLKLILRPLLSGRSYFGIRKNYENLTLLPEFASPRCLKIDLRDGLPFFYMNHSASWNQNLYTYWNQYYHKTAEREEEPYENLWSPGEFSYDIDKDRPAHLVFSRNGCIQLSDVDSQIEHETLRRISIKNTIQSSDPRITQLAISSEQFLFTRPDGKESILAGFPWFLDWGRDTFISIEGLLLIKGRVQIALQILKNFAQYEKQGLLPNMFPTFSNSPAYNSVDAPLWFIHTSFKTLEYGASEAVVINDLWPTMVRIINHYIQGTDYNIKADPRDGLVAAGIDGQQLTWMDAKVDGWVVTPRRGKPIEINALWYEALKNMIKLAEKQKLPINELANWKRYKELVEQNFRSQFYDSVQNQLRDVADAEDFKDEQRIRPNALYALVMLGHLFTHDEALKILARIEQELLTPYGLRSLSPSDSLYHPYYVGNLRQRDGAYHQGTTWSYLLGIYVDAVIKIRGIQEKQRLVQFLERIIEHSRIESTGHVAEIFDAEAPFKPRGCYAQAWSSAELLRVYHQLGLIRFIP